MRIVYILNITSYSTEEINQVIKKLLLSLKSFLNYQVINKSINKANLSILRAPQMKKKSQEQFKFIVEKKKIVFEFYCLKESIFFERLLKKIKLYSTYSNTDMFIKKKIYFNKWEPIYFTKAILEFLKRRQ